MTRTRLVFAFALIASTAALVAQAPPPVTPPPVTSAPTSLREQIPGLIRMARCDLP